MAKFATTFIFVVLFFSGPAFGQQDLALQNSPGHVRNFHDWKELQVLEAQNQVLRVSAKITQIRTGKVHKSAAAKEPAPPLPSGRVKTTADHDPLSSAEKELRRAREGLENANNLDLNDYVTVYLPSLDGQPEGLQNLLNSLSKEELADIVKALIANQSRNNASRKSPVFSGLLNNTTSSN